MLRFHQSGTGKIGNPVGRCPTQLATIFYHQKNFPTSTYEIIMLGNKSIIKLMARERISLYPPRFCYRQAPGHTPIPHNQIEGSWFSTLQIWCALNSAISTPTTQWRTPSNKPTAMWRRFEIHHTAAPYTSTWQLSQHSQNQRLLACHTHKTTEQQTSSLHFRFV